MVELLRVATIELEDQFETHLTRQTLCDDLGLALSRTHLSLTADWCEATFGCLQS